MARRGSATREKGRSIQRVHGGRRGTGWRLAAGLSLGLTFLAQPAAHADSDWQQTGARLAAMIEAELGLTQQATDIERALDALAHEQAGAEHSAALLDHAGRESLRHLEAYQTGAHERELQTRQRARAMYKAARGGIARLAFEELDAEGSTTAERLARGRDLRWLVRRDLTELAAYQRAERRARVDLLRAQRQHQALSVLATVHGMQGELLATARTATRPALARAEESRRVLLARDPERDRLRRVYRERLALLSEHSRALRSVSLGAGTEILRRPTRGRVVGRFGAYEDRSLHLPMMRNGIELAAQRDEDVRAPASGKVVMVATLPGYEQVVVIDHGDGSLSMLGRLWKIAVAEGDEVQATQVIAAAAPKVVDDGLGRTVYLELRHGGKPVDPEPHLRW